MKHIILKLLIIFFIAINFSCQYFTQMSFKEWKIQNNQNDVDVYVAGNYISHPCYWKNGERIDLKLSGANGDVFAMCIDGSNLYCAGYAQDSGILKATYWKNGEKFIIDNSASIINSICVVNGIVYSAGYLTPSTACYWINDKRYNLIIPAGQSYSNAIFVNKDTMDFYIFGYYINGNNFLCYWKNGGNPIDLTNGTYSNSETKGIIYKNGKLYIPYINFLEGNRGYWSDGKITQLPGAPTVIHSVYVYNEDVYSAGRTGANALLWKNQTLTTLPGATGAAYSVYVFDNDVYAAGTFVNTINNACYWKNGELVNLSPSITNVSYAYSIIVKPKN